MERQEAGGLQLYVGDLGLLCIFLAPYHKKVQRAQSALSKHRGRKTLLHVFCFVLFLVTNLACGVGCSLNLVTLAEQLHSWSDVFRLSFDPRFRRSNPFFLCKILPLMKGTQLRATCKRKPHTRTCRCVPGAAPPTQLLSRERAGP